MINTCGFFLLLLFYLFIYFIYLAPDLRIGNMTSHVSSTAVTFVAMVTSACSVIGAVLSSYINGLRRIRIC